MIIVYFIPDKIHNINQSCINVRFALYLCALNMSSNKMERKKQNKTKILHVFQNNFVESHQ